jgi:ATP-dependent RNA helicase DeaD
VRLMMSVGKREGIRPADVVGSIANEADVPGREIGPIEIRDEVTYVTVPSRYVEVILAKVGRAKFRGKHVNLRVAGKEEPAPQRRAYGSSREGFAPPSKKPYAPRRYDTAPPRRDGAPPARRAPDRGDFAPRGKKPFTPRGKPGPGKFGKR